MSQVTGITGMEGGLRSSVIYMHPYYANAYIVVTYTCTINDSPLRDKTGIWIPFTFTII